MISRIGDVEVARAVRNHPLKGTDKIRVEIHAKGSA